MKYGRRNILSGATRLGALTMFGSVLHPLAEALAASDDTAITRDLIGTLEGPEVVLDPALWPKQFQEAPMLAARVAAGALPAVKDRVGADPLVIKPLHEIGRYGGTWRQGFTGPGDVWNAWRAATGPDSLLAWDWTGNKAMPKPSRASCKRASDSLTRTSPLTVILANSVAAGGRKYQVSPCCGARTSSLARRRATRSPRPRWRRGSAEIRAPWLSPPSS